jgi:CHAT domain-containing protein
LRWFDREMLGMLAECGENEIEALLASDLVVAAPKSTGTYRLRDDIRAGWSTRLRSEWPHTELTLQRRVFGYFLRRLRESSVPERLNAENDCFYHLRELALLLAEYLDWHAIAEFAAAARAAEPQQQRHLLQLQFYNGYVAIRTQEYSRGEAILKALIERSDLEDELRAPILLGLGHAQWYKTHYDRALTFYQQSQAAAARIGDRLFEAQAIIASSMVYSELGYHDQALEFSQQSLHIARALGNRYREAHALYEIGNNAMYLGRWLIAQDHFETAIRLYEMLGVNVRLRMLYWMQGFLHHLLGAETESEAAYLRAVVISQGTKHGEPSIRMDAWLYLGLLYQTQARWDEALAAYDQAIALATQLGNQHWLSLIHYRCGNVFARQGRLDQAYAAYAQAINGIEALRGATETEEIKIGLLGTAQQVYESMVLLCLDLDRPAEAFHYVERARSRALLDLLASRQSQADPMLYDAMAQPVATLAEVQSQLRADALLLEYFTIGVLPRGESLINQLPAENTRLRKHLTLPPQTIIFAITRDGLEVFRPLFDPNVLRPQPGDPGPGGRLLRDWLLTHLHAQLIAPATALLHGRALLYLIPHGPLHYVPFMALRSAAGAHLLDAAGPAITLAPSATVLLRNCLGRARAAHHSAPLLALGYNDEDEAGLRYAEAEAGHVARLGGGEAWAGPATKSRQLIAAGRQARWLHIAGHAVYDPHDPLGSYIQLGKDDPLSARAIMRDLVLDVDLVTLSACMSGISQVMSGDELFGLQRAFLYAGAPAVVCTLWEAADFVALLVMDRFYTALHAGSPPAGALRDAQVALRSMTGRDLLTTLDRWRAEDPAFVAALGDLPEVPPDALDAAIYADPFYWAPFMLIGKPD